MKNRFLFILIIIYILILSNINCSIENKTNNIFSRDSLVIYNYDYKPDYSAIALKDDSFYLTNAESPQSLLIIASYINNSIVLLSPSKDTLRFSNNDTTGIMDIGTFGYSYPPEDGYLDMEYLNKKHYYFIKFPNEIYGRLYIYYYDFDSIICKLEILLEGTSFE